MNLLSAAMSPSAGLWNPPGSSASQNKAARALPILAANATCPGSQVSSVAERTLEMCVPRERWTPCSCVILFFCFYRYGLEGKKNERMSQRAREKEKREEEKKEGRKR